MFGDVHGNGERNIMNLSTDNQMNNSDENEQISTCPPSVIRGAKLHEAEIGIDWLRFTMPFNRLHQMTNKRFIRLMRTSELKKRGHGGLIWSYNTSIKRSIHVHKSVIPCL